LRGNGRRWSAEPSIASALIGASSPAQVEENVGALKQLDFSAEELVQIDAITIPRPRY
jgi:L-glyceraldehyde 3-phosphate reductase